MQRHGHRDACGPTAGPGAGQLSLPLSAPYLLSGVPGQPWEPRWSQGSRFPLRRTRRRVNAWASASPPRCSTPCSLPQGPGVPAAPQIADPKREGSERGASLRPVLRATSHGWLAAGRHASPSGRTPLTGSTTAGSPLSPFRLGSCGTQRGAAVRGRGRELGAELRTACTAPGPHTVAPARPAVAGGGPGPRPQRYLGSPDHRLLPLGRAEPLRAHRVPVVVVLVAWQLRAGSPSGSVLPGFQHELLASVLRDRGRRWGCTDVGDPPARCCSQPRRYLEGVGAVQGDAHGGGQAGGDRRRGAVLHRRRRQRGRAGLGRCGKGAG